MNDIKFDNLERKATIQNLADEKWDLIVIGGGITGAGIALDAALRGIKTLLLEKQDFASGTSSKSTKLIHGGLRYLKQLEIGLVRETGTERAIAHHNIPHLVHPERMLLPIVKKGTFGKLSASMAISVYDWLADVPSKDKKRSLNKIETKAQEPLLNDNILLSGISYAEYRTDDARLTMEIIKSARRAGAEAINYLSAKDFIYHEEKLIGIKCEDHLTGDALNISGTQIVSAAGPWVDQLRTIDQSNKGKSLHLTKGVHVVVDRSRLPLQQSVYFDAFDGRMIFAIPRGVVTYIGTSDTSYAGDMNRVLCSVEDMNYLLSAANQMFPNVDLVSEDVISSWAGLRPLIHEDGKAPSELSRKDEIFESESGLISIAGGKLTGYRKMAQRIVDLAIEKHPDWSQVDCKTKQHRIHADSFRSYDEFSSYHQGLYERYQSKGLSEMYSWYLASTYGKHADLILKQADHGSGVDFYSDVIKAEIEYTIKYEAATQPDDYFNRRSGHLYFNPRLLDQYFDLIHDVFADHFQWSDQYLAAAKSKSKQLIHDCIHIGQTMAAMV